MATGWAQDGAVQEQIEDSIQDAVQRARSQLPSGDSLSHCEECDAAIPQARREAVPGVRLCITCQSEQDRQLQQSSGYNRRGSKDSQLR
ncbi:MAG: DksA/TraR family C4-type zinc finger protein [Gammaproteobacteria bacterium]|jgi:phage/conjugal plasmid C-4 type zinc finger TraR family protein|nr:DksA/TraR family C4-type zinc finger protein [Gammaproteobacteria bacterium]